MSGCACECAGGVSGFYFLVCRAYVGRVKLKEKDCRKEAGRAVQLIFQNSRHHELIFLVRRRKSLLAAHHGHGIQLAVLSFELKTALIDN